MAKKLDTNPLDPEFPAKAKEVKTQRLFSEKGETRGFADPLDTEEQTRPLENGGVNGFDPDGYAPPRGVIAPLPEDESAKNRRHTIGSITLPENILLALPYIPFAFIGLIAGIIELIFVPKNEPRLRYHAAQGVAAQIGVWLVITFLGLASFGSDLADVASTVFSIVTTICLLVFAFKAWQGKPIHIETVESLTDWIEEKISPKN